MYINSCIPWMKDREKFQQLVNMLYRLGYQAAIVELHDEKEYKEYIASEFFLKEKLKVDFPVSLSSIRNLKPKDQDIALIPRITLKIRNPNDLKQKLAFWAQKRVLISVEATNKDVLEVAARDGRVDIISLPSLEHQQALTKGIISLARQNKCMLHLSITPLLEVEHFKRTHLLRVFYRLFKSAKPISNLYILGSHRRIKDNLMLVRGPKESIAILTSIFRLPEYFAKEFVSKNVEVLFLRYIKRDLSLFVEPGVEIVAIDNGGKDIVKYIRQRYILFEIVTEEAVAIEKNAVVRKIWKKLIRLFGEFTTFHVGLWMIRWEPERKIGILRCDNITKSEVIAVLGLIKHINSIPVIFHTRKTSGTIKKTLRLWRYYFKSDPPKREDK